MQTSINNQGYLYTFAKDSFAEEISNTHSSRSSRLKSELILTVVADDHPYLLHGVEADLNKDPKIKIIASAGSYDELLEKVRTCKPHIVLLDLRMPGYEKHNLKQFIASIKTFSNCKVLIFSNEIGWARINRCLEVGASAFIEKAIGFGRLSELIQMVYKNDDLVIYTTEQMPQLQFSKRQSEILHYIAEGKENDEIADLLEIDIKTVQSYLNEVKNKLSDAFNMPIVRPRTLLLLSRKLGFGTKLL